MRTYLIADDRAIVAVKNGTPAKRDNRVVVTWSLAAGIVSLLHSLAEWNAMHTRQSQVMEALLTSRNSGDRHD